MREILTYVLHNIFEFSDKKYQQRYAIAMGKSPGSVYVESGGVGNHFT